jgi:integrase
MKAGRNFRAPLSPAAKIIVESRPRLCEFVFTTNGRSAIQGWNRWKEALDREMALILKQSIPDFRIHDLRRTCASGLASLSYGTETIKRLLGHAPPKSDVTWVYNRHSYDDEAREAVTRWAAHIARLVSGLEVVPSQPAA